MTGFAEITYAVIVICLFLTLLFVEYYSRKIGVGPSPSSPRTRRAIVEELKDLRTENPEMDKAKVYELGSGWGHLAISTAKAFPNMDVIGVEISVLPFWISQLRRKLGGQKNLHFIRGNFLEMSLDDADIVLTYLTVNLLNKLRPKLARELPESAYVICNTFSFDSCTPLRTKHVCQRIYEFNIFVYTKETLKMTDSVS